MRRLYPDVPFGFFQMWCCVIWPDISILVLCFQRTVFQEETGIVIEPPTDPLNLGRDEAGVDHGLIVAFTCGYLQKSYLFNLFLLDFLLQFPPYWHSLTLEDGQSFSCRRENHGSSCWFAVVFELYCVFVFFSSFHFGFWHNPHHLSGLGSRSVVMGEMNLNFHRGDKWARAGSLTNRRHSFDSEPSRVWAEIWLCAPVLWNVLVWCFWVEDGLKINFSSGQLWKTFYGRP